MAKFIVMHSRTLADSQADVVIRAIEATGAKKLDATDKVYLFDGDISKAKEIVSPFIGEWSVTPLKQTA